MLLKGTATEVKAMVEAITPHSFRAGMASDLEREDVPRMVIKKMGRWNSARAMEQYMRDGLAQRLSKIEFWNIASKRGRIRRILKKSSARYKIADASEGYDDSAEGSGEDVEC